MENKSLGSAIFNNVKQFRKEAGLTQPQLAVKVAAIINQNMTHDYISHIENNKRRPHLHVALALCQALGRTPDETFYLKFTS